MPAAFTDAMPPGARSLLHTEAPRKLVERALAFAQKQRLAPTGPDARNQQIGGVRPARVVPGSP